MCRKVSLYICMYLFQCLSVYLTFSKVTVEHWMVCREVSLYACICLNVCLSVCLSFSQVFIEHWMVCRKVSVYMPLSVCVSISPKLLLSIAWCAGRYFCMCLYLSVCLSFFQVTVEHCVVCRKVSLCMPVSVSVSVCLSLFLPSYC